MGVTIIHGASGSGKTSYLLEQVAELVARGRTVGGLAAPAVFDDGRRQGYDLLDVRRGVRRCLARVGPPSPGELVVGPYHFAPQAFAEGNAAVIGAMRDGFEFVVIDEIGPLEFDGNGWAPSLELSLRECQPGQTLVLVVRERLVERLPDRFNSAFWTTARRLRWPWPPSLLIRQSE